MHTLEHALWEKVRLHDDRRAFDLLYRQLWDTLYRFPQYRTKDDAIAQDLVQEVFVGFWEKRKQIVIKDSVKHYFLGALRYRLR